jgi:hypothetical protein
MKGYDKNLKANKTFSHIPRACNVEFQNSVHIWDVIGFEKCKLSYNIFKDSCNQKSF